MAQGVMFVELVPTTTGIKRGVEKDLGGAFDASETKAKSFWGKVAGFGVAAAATLTTAVGVVTGIAVKGGFSRLLKIEDATAKLKGLGNSAETVTAIMDNSLAAVKGTAFGLDAAATVAAGAVAAGIKPGTQLSGVLKTIADTATIAGKSMEDTGKIFNSVAARGKLQGDDLMQLQSAGVPVLAFLAKHYGITAQAASKMVSDGKVDFENFAAAMKENLGGAALESGNTTRGAYANMLASLSRVGANLLSGVFPMFKLAFQGITNALAPIEDKAKVVGAAIGATFEKVIPAIQGVMTLLATGDFTSAIRKATGLAEDSPLVSFVLGLRDAFESVKGILAPLGILAAGALAPLLSGLPFIGKFLPVISGPLGLIVGGIGALLAISPELRDALGGAFQTIVGAVGDVMTQLTPVMKTLVPVVLDLAKTLGGLLGRALTLLVPFIVQVIGLFGDLLARTLPMLLPVIEQLGFSLLGIISAVIPLVQSILIALMPAIESLVPVILSIIAAVLPLVSTFVSALIPAFQSLAPMIMGVIAAVLPLVASLISALMPAFSALVPIVLAVIQAVLPLVSVLIGALMPIITALIPVVVSLLDAFLPLIMTLLNVLVPVIQMVAQILTAVLIPVIGLVVGVIQFLAGIFTWAIKTIIVPYIGILSAVFTLLWQGVIQPIASFIVGAITSIADTTATVFGAIGGIIKGAFTGVGNFIKDFINGVIGLINDVIGGINDIAAGVKAVTFGAVDVHLSKIPRLADGAYINATPGGSIVNVGEGRYDEAVVPLTPDVKAAFEGRRGGGSNVEFTQNIHPAPGMSEETIGQIAANEFNYRLRRA